MTVREYLVATARKLSSSESSWLDALLLAEWATGTKREELLADLLIDAGAYFSGIAKERFDRGVDKRQTGVPIAYIVGRRGFWNDDFLVGPGVLVPRPETETVVERAVEYLSSSQTVGRTLRIADCCTGSGAIGISVAREIADGDREIALVLTDFSSEALNWARRNVDRILAGYEKITVEIRMSHLLDEVAGSFDLITANPPYLSETEADEVLGRGWTEPREALAAGLDGMALYPELARSALALLASGGRLIVECAPAQADTLLALFLGEVGYTSGSVHKDIAGQKRVVEVSKESEI